MNIFSSIFSSRTVAKPEQPVPPPKQPLQEKPNLVPILNRVEELFKACVDWPLVDLEQFASFHLQSYLQRTSALPKGSVSQGVNFWIHYLGLWQLGKGLIIPFEISDKQMLALQTELEIYHEFHLLIEREESHKGVDHHDYVVKTASTFSELLAKHLKERQRCYVPLGYRSGLNSDGHSITVLFEKRGTTIVVHVLNKGDGSDVHPQTGWTTTQDIRTFRYPPIHVKEEVLFGPVGFSFLVRQIQLLTTDPRRNAIYEAQDLYGALLLIGKVQPSFEDEFELIQGKSQSGQVCADMASRLLVIDCLQVHLKVRPYDRNRMVFNAKLCSFMRLSLSLDSGLITRDFCEVLLLAHRELCVAVNERSNGRLSSEEMILCHSILKRVRERIDHAKEGLTIQSHRLIFKMPESIMYSNFDTDPLKSGRPISQKADPKMVIDRPFPSTDFDADTFLSTLKEWNGYLGELIHACAKADFEQLVAAVDRFVHYAVDRLPIPSAMSDEWDQLAQNEVEETLAELWRFLHLAQCKDALVTPRALFFPTFLMLHTVYAIADKLARRLTETRLEGFASPYFLHDLKAHGKFRCLLLGRDSARLAKIEAYFLGLQTRHPQRAFHFRRRLDLGAELAEQKTNTRSSTPWGQSLNYLAQFQSLLPNEILGSDSEVLFTALWLDQYQILPSAVNHLRSISYAAYTWLASQKTQFKVPTSMSEEYQPISSKVYVIILALQEIRSFPSHQDLQNSAHPWHSQLSEQNVGPSQSNEVETPVNEQLFFLQSARLASVNAAFCLPTQNGLKGFSAATYRELRAMKCIPNLQVASMIAWGLDHLTSLEDPLLQMVLEAFLFAPHLLQKQVAEEPQWIVSLRQFVQEGLAAYEKTQRTELFLYFLSLGYFIETHVIEALGDVWQSEEQIQIYRHRMESEYFAEEGDAVKNRYYLLLTYTHYRSLNQGQVREILRHRFHLIRYNQCLPARLRCLEGRFEGLWQQVEVDVDRLSIHALCDALLPDCTPDSISQEPWEGVYPTFSKGSYVIDFASGMVSKNGIPLLCPSIKGDTVSDRLRDFIDPTTTFYWKEGYFESDDGKSRLLPGAQSHELQRKFCVENQEDWYTLSSFGEEPIWCREPTKRFYLITSRTFDSQPLAIMVQNGEHLRWIRLDAKGISTTLVLLNLLHLHPDIEPWYLQAEALGSAESIRCYVDTRSHLISLVEFLDLKLTFRGEWIEERWVLRCGEYPSFWLAAHQEVFGLPGFIGLLALENGSGERLVILPDRSLEFIGNGFTTTGKFKNSTQCSHFLFEVSGDRLHSESPNANLLLAELYVAFKEYRKALVHLSHCRSYQSGFIQLCETRFNSWIDSSPEGLAFLLRVALHCMTERRLLTRATYQGNAEPLCDIFWPHIAKSFTCYLRVVGATDEHGSVPAYIRLSTKEEQELLTFVHHCLRDINEPGCWNYLLENRLRLTGSPECLVVRLESAAIQQFPKELVSSELPRSAPMFLFEEELPIPPHVIRTSPKQLGYAISSLLDSAKNAGKEFPAVFDLDLFYLVRSVPKGKWTSHFAEVLWVLLYVRHYPEHFADINFQEVGSTDDYLLANKRVLELVAKKVLLPAQYRTSLSKVYIPQKDLELLLPWPAPVPRKTWPSVQPISGTLDKTFSALREHLFKTTSLNVQQSFYLEDKVLQPKTALEKRLYEQLVRGFITNSKQIESIYSLSKDCNLGEIRCQQERLIITRRTQLAAQRAQIEALANWMPQDDASRQSLQQIRENTLRRIRQGALLHPVITLDGDLIWAFMQDDVAVIEKLNPHLSPAQLRDLHRTLKEYLASTIFLHQGEDIAKWLLKIESSSGAIREHYIQCLGRLLDECIDLSHPVLEVYQYLAKKRLTPEQVAIILWIIKSPNFHGPSALPALSPLLFAFRAGGGKTTILLTILMQMARARGFLPISIAPASLYSIERHKQGSVFKNIFNLPLSVLEVGLEDQIDDALWKQTYDGLVTDHANGCALIMEPAHYHALYLHYLLALDQRKVESVRWLSKILLDFFPSKGLAFIDECPHNLDPLLQTRLGIGSPCSVPPSHFQILLDCYHVMLDQVNPRIILKDGRTIGQALRLAEGKQAATKDLDKAICREALASYMGLHPVLGLSQNERDLFVPYWLDRSQRRPKQLEQIHLACPEKAELIALMRGFFTEYFGFVLGLVSKTDHGPSLNGSEPFETPRQDTRPTLCQYADPYVAGCVSAQATFQQPLRTDQVVALVSKLRSLHSSQKPFSIDQYSQLFQTWVGKDYPSLTEISTEKWIEAPTKQEVEIINILSNCFSAKDWYLKNIVFPAITYSPDSLVSTARHLAHGFNSTVLFTATPGLPELYFLEENSPLYRSDYPSQEAVEARFCRGSTEQIIFSERAPLAFFAEISRLRPGLFPGCCAMIDPENALRKGNTEIAKAFLTFVMQNQLPYDGVLYYQDSEGLESQSTSLDTLLFWRSLGERPIPIIGGDVENAFPKMGLNWNKMRVMVLFDASHALAANIPLPLDASILYVLGENLALEKSVQAKKRDRQILERQTCVIAIPDYLAKAIPTDDKGLLSPKAQTFWTLANQAKKHKEKLVAGVYQEIDYIVEDALRKKLKEALDEPEDQIRIYHRYKRGIIKRNQFSPYERFSSADQLDASNEVLLTYAKERYQQFEYPTPWKNASSTRACVKNVISSIQQLVPRLPSRTENHPGQGARLHTLQKQQLQQHLTDCSNLVPSVPDLNLPMLSKSHFVSSFLTHSQLASKAFACAGLTSELYYSKNALNCASSGGKSLGIAYLVPVDYLLIVKQDLSFKAFALSSEEAEIFKDQLVLGSKRAKHQALLVSRQGRIVQRANGAMRLDQASQQSLFESNWFKDVIADVSLIHGQFRFHERLLARLPTWPDFGAFWLRVTRYHPHSERIQIPPVGPLAQAIQDAPKVEAEATRSSFLDNFRRWWK